MKNLKYLALLMSVAAMLPSCQKESDGNETNPYETKIPNALPGLFTVSAGSDSIDGTGDEKTVHFSKGNLYCVLTGIDSIPYAFAFDNEQYGYHTRKGKVHYSYNEEGVQIALDSAALSVFPGLVLDARNNSGLFQWISSSVSCDQSYKTSYGAFSTLRATKVVGKDNDDAVFTGMISGSDKGAYKDNVFVSDSFAGLGGASYAGKAEPISYKALIRRNSTPEEFRTVNVRFTRNGELIEERKIQYGDSIDTEDYPILPSNEEYYGRWINPTEGPIYNDMVIMAEDCFAYSSKKKHCLKKFSFRRIRLYVMRKRALDEMRFAFL